MAPPAIIRSTTSLRCDAKVIGLIGLAHATSHFFHLILAPIFPWLRTEFGLGYAQLGLLMTVFFLVSGIGQAVAGFVVDKVGALPVHLIGLSLLALSALGLAASRNYAMLVAFEGLAGLGNSVFHPAGFTILNKRVSEPRLGHAFSWHGVSGNIGWAVAPIFLAGLATLSNWRIALLAGAVLPFVVLCVLVYFRRDLSTRQAPCPPPPDAAAPLPLPVEKMNPLSFIGLPGVWLCFAFFLITAMSAGGIQSFAPSALQALYGGPVVMATACITAYMLASAVGMIVGGFLGARTVQHEKVIAVAFAVAGLLSVLVATGTVPAALTMLLLALIGFGAGIAGPSRDLMVRAAAPPNATGRVYGVVYSGLDVGLSLAPLLFGGLMDTHHPSGVFIMIGVFQCLALFTAIGIGSRRSPAPKPTGNVDLAVPLAGKH